MILRCSEDEYPVHTVEITRSFALMKTEVTQELYEAVIGKIIPVPFLMVVIFPLKMSAGLMLYDLPMS